MLANSFTEKINFAIDRIFPIQTVKIHHTDKQWMTPNFKKTLVNLRQQAFHSGNKDLWRHRIKVRNEIRRNKRAYYENKVKNPKKWWTHINQMSGKKNQYQITLK